MKVKFGELQRIVTNQVSHKLSFSYDKYDNVETLMIHQDEQLYKVEGIVNVLGKKNEYHVELNSSGEVIAYACGCGWCKEGNACAHIGAVILKLEKLVVDSLPFNYQSNKEQYLAQLKEQQAAEKRKQKQQKLLSIGRSLMEQHKVLYEKELEATTQRSAYELEPEVNVEYNKDIVLSFRIGKDKKYVVQDIKHLLMCIEHKKEHSYGKFLKFLHHIDAFDEDAKKQIYFLYKVCAYYEYQAQQNYFYQPPSIKKHIIITNELLDDFFDTYKEIEVSHLRLLEKQQPIKIQIEEVDDMYRLSYDGTEYMEGNSHAYQIVNEGKDTLIIRNTLDEKGHVLQLLRQLRQDDIIVLKEEYEQFYKYVLSDIQAYISIHGVDLSTKVYEPYERICLYGDIDEAGSIYVKLDCYNEEGNRINGFDQHRVTNFTQDVVETYIKKFAQVIDYDAHLAYFDQDADDTFTFMNEGLPFLSQYCEIYVSDALQKLKKQQSYSISLGVKMKNNLLEIDIESLQIPSEELSNVLQSYRKKRKFHRLKNGELLNLQSEELQQLDTLLMSQHMQIQDIENGRIQAPMYRMFSLDDELTEAKGLTVHREESFQQQISRFKDVKHINCEIPQAYSSILRDYQKEGYKWLSVLRNYGFHGILADDMGLGKTLQVICMLEGLQEQGTSIVVCPSSLVYNWIDEIQKFSKNLKACCVVGNATNRKALIDTYEVYDVIITSYDYIRRDIDIYEGKQFLYVILDEAQYIKNQRTKNAMSVKQLQSNYRLALTGTPIENSLAELWSIFDFLMPNYLFPYAYFQKQFETEIVKNHNVEKQEALKKLVSPFILRRNKQDVLTELPDKIEKTQYIEFEEEEQKLYLANLAKCNKQLQEMVQDDQPDKIAILAMLTRLRQLCCEPRLMYDNIETPSSKMKACLELIETLRENKQKVLIFSGFTSVLELLANELTKRHISYYILTGSTNKEERRELVQRFQNDDTMVFLISLKAGGTGLNLTAAQAVIHYDPWWNQSAQNQASDRAYRMGQQHNVQVFKLVMKNSIEEKIEQMQLRKKELANMFVENNEGSISTMSQQELMDLFAIK